MQKKFDAAREVPAIKNYSHKITSHGHACHVDSVRFAISNIAIVYKLQLATD